MKRKVLIIISVLLLSTMISTAFSSVYAATNKAPAKVIITSAIASKNAITIKVKKISKVKKYQLFYKTSLESDWKSKCYTGEKYTLKSLLFASTYEVKVRAYNGKWGKCSNVKTVDTATKVKMTALSSMKDKVRTTKALLDNYDNSYNFAVTNDLGYSGSSGPVTYEYITNAKYKTFAGTLYIPRGQESGGRSALIVKGDGHVLYTSPSVDKISSPIDFRINIAGIKNLSVIWPNNSGYKNLSDLECCIGNPYFYYSNPTDTPVDIDVLPIELTDLSSIYSDTYVTSRLKDNYGNTYSSAIYNRVDHYHSNHIPTYEYLFNSKYKKLTGTLYVPEGLSFSDSVNMTITGDGKILYKSPEMTKISPPEKFNVNVSGCNDVKITFSERSWYDSTMDKTLCLAYLYLFY